MKYKYVYFIRPVGMEGPIKIGCAMDLARRINAIEVCSPFPLEIAAVVSGGIGLERKLHEHFRASRTHGEWFRPTPGLLALIRHVQAGGQIRDVIDITSIKIPRIGGPRPATPRVMPDIYEVA